MLLEDSRWFVVVFVCVACCWCSLLLCVVVRWLLLFVDIVCRCSMRVACCFSYVLCVV